MKTSKSFYIIVCIMCFSFLNTQAQFKIGGELRTRSFINYGYQEIPVRGDDPAIYVEQRTRINFFYQKEKIQFYFSGQDDRVWGQDQFAGSNSLGIDEAWINFLAGKYFSFKLGRQEIGYDNGRLISDADWNNWGNSFDIGLFRYDNTDTEFEVDLGIGINNRNASNFTANYDVNFYKYLTYLWINKKILDGKVDISWMNIVNAAQRQDDISLHSDTLITVSGDQYVVQKSIVKSYPDVLYVNFTTGVFANINFHEHLFYEGEFYFQGGKTIAGKDLKAILWSSWLNARLGKFIFGVGYQFASGTDLSDTLKAATESNTFNYNMYGNQGDPFFGDMSYFIHPAGTNSAGITDIVGTFGYIPNDQWTFKLFVHYLGLANAYISPLIKVDKHLGIEFDFTIDWEIRKDLEFEFCYGFMLPENSLKELQGIPINDHRFANYAKIQIEYTPWFFKTK